MAKTQSKPTDTNNWKKYLISSVSIGGLIVFIFWTGGFYYQVQNLEKNYDSMKSDLKTLTTQRSEDNTNIKLMQKDIETINSNIDNILSLSEKAKK